MRHRILLLVILLTASCCRSQTQVSLTWTASVSQCASGCAAGTGATLIVVYRASVPSNECSGATWTQIATGVPPSGPYTDTLPTPGNYCYEVKAYFSSVGLSKLSAGSNWFHVYLTTPTPPALTVPAAPTGLTTVQ